MAQSSDVLDERGELLRAAKEDESLIDEVGTEVVGETIGRDGEVLPGVLEGGSVAIKAMHANVSM